MINNALPDVFDEHDDLDWHSPATPKDSPAARWSERLRAFAALVAEWFRTRIVRRLRVPPVRVTPRIPVAQLPPDDQSPLDPPRPARLLEVRRISPAARGESLTGGSASPDAASRFAGPACAPPQGFCEQLVLLDEAAAALGRLAVRRPRPAGPTIRPQPEADEPLLMLLPPAPTESELPAGRGRGSAAAVAEEAPLVVSLIGPSAPPPAKPSDVPLAKAPDLTIDACWIGVEQASAPAVSPRLARERMPLIEPKALAAEAPPRAVTGEKPPNGAAGAGLLERAEATPAADAAEAMSPVARRVVYVQDGAVLPLSARRVRRTTSRVRPARREAAAQPQRSLVAAAAASTEAFHDDGL
jgi:hypothetical protein